MVETWKEKLTNYYSLWKFKFGNKIHLNYLFQSALNLSFDKNLAIKFGLFLIKI